MHKKATTTIKPWVLVLIFVAVWRLGLLLLGFAADSFLLYQPTFPYFDSILPETHAPRWLYSWANFDGVHYLTIVTKGYLGTGLIQAFFPLYPLLATGLAVLGTSPFVSLFTVNHLALFSLAAMWWYWVSEKWGKKIAVWSLLFFFLSPTAFFLGATYTESLFLLLIVATFWLAHRGNWVAAAVVAGLASATRIVGVALVPALALEWYLTLNHKPKPQEFLKVLLPIVTLGSLGLISYMLYLWRTFGDPLYFYHVQSEFGAGRQEGIVLLPQVLWRAIKIVLTYQTTDWRLWAYWQELVLSVVTFAGLGATAFWKKTSPGLLLFSGIAVLLPTLTGTLSSMPRYILISLSLWIWLGHLASTRRWLFVVFLIVSSLALFINTVLFIQGYWVA